MTESAGRLSPSLAAARLRVIESLQRQGFTLSDSGLVMTSPEDKDSLRQLHHHAMVAHRERARAAFQGRETPFLSRMIDGKSLDIQQTRPKLIPIELKTSFDARTWRWVSLHWSIPTSIGYGRRLRYLVVDSAHDDALMGILGLADPVYAMAARDLAIGWSEDTRKRRLSNMMDAYVLGSVPPYSALLGGKLVASLLGASEIRQHFSTKYGHKPTLISARDPDANLSAVTTTSALGRSSIYNRLQRSDGSRYMESLGYTRGSGDFHFSGEIYEELVQIAAEANIGKPTQRHERWGVGFRNRREVTQKALRVLQLKPDQLRVHGVKREVFISRLARNADAYLRGDDLTPIWRDETVEDISAWWKHRWAIPRAKRSVDWRTFEAREWLLYPLELA